MLPSKSSSSLKKGSWFICNHDGDVIHAWKSRFFKREKVYLNGNLVSKRYILGKSKHKFKNQKGIKYELEFERTWLFTNELICKIQYDKKRLKRFSVDFNKEKGTSRKQKIDSKQSERGCFTTFLDLLLLGEVPFIFFSGLILMVMSIDKLDFIFEHFENKKELAQGIAIILVGIIFYYIIGDKEYDLFESD